MIRLARRLPHRLRRHGLVMAALLGLALAAPWPQRQHEARPLALAPPPAVTAGMIERMQ